jgi:hypothetical protein
MKFRSNGQSAPPTRDGAAGRTRETGVRSARHGTRRRARAAALAALAAFALSAAAAPAAAAGARVLWSARSEGVDLSEWSRDGGGGVYNSGTGTVAVQREVVHSGRFGMRLSIAHADGRSGDQAARLFRWRTRDGSPLPTTGYYSAWYRFPTRVSPTQFWNVFQSKTKLSDDQVDPTFVLNVDARPSGRMYLYLWDAIAERDRGASPIALPLDRWVHVEALYRWSTSATGRVIVWQDGRKILDAGRVRTTYPSRDPNRRQWGPANYTNGLSPPSATIYVDDAAISASRLGAAGRGQPRRS